MEDMDIADGGLLTSEVEINLNVLCVLGGVVYFVVKVDKRARAQRTVKLLM
jgi:hypothetical protein